MRYKKITSPSFFIGQNKYPIISFGSGQPDIAPPKACFSILKNFHDFAYGPVQGQEELRIALAHNHKNTKPRDFVITNGASEAIDLVLRALYKKNGIVLIPKPYYYSYPHNVRLAHLSCDYYTLKNGKINQDTIMHKVASADMMIINSPGNPTGTIQDHTLLQQIVTHAKKHDTIIITDDVYEYITHTHPHKRLYGTNVVTINSFSKTYSLCGERIGFVFSSNTDLINKIITIKTHTSMNTSIVSQQMALAALQTSKNYITKNQMIWKKRRDLLYGALSDLGFKTWQPDGAFYIFATVNNAQKVMEDLYYKHNVIVYSGEWFGQPNKIRFSYAVSEDRIIEGLERLKKYIATNPHIIT